MEQLIALIIGLVIYAFLGKKDKKKRVPQQGPVTVAPPVPPKPAPKPEPEPEPMMEEEDDDEDDDDNGMTRESVTFEELLEQFGNTEKKPRGPVKVRAQKERGRGIGEEFVAARSLPEEKEPDINQFYKDSDANTHSIMTEDDLKDGHSANYMLTEKGYSKYTKLLSDPQSLRDAVILKEILDRKHFDW